MINLDFGLAVSFYLVLVVCLVFALWFLSKTKKNKDLSLDPKFIWFCSVCTYTYINTKEEKISLCPRCSSYNKK